MASNRQLFIFFNQLTTMLQSGIPLEESIRSLSKRKVFKGEFRRDLIRLRYNLENGKTLSDALHHFPSMPLIYSNMMRASEKSGRLPEITQEIQVTLTRWIAFQTKILLACLYPAVLVHMAVIAPRAGLLISEGFGEFAKIIGVQFLYLYLFFIAIYLFYVVIRRSNYALNLIDDVVMALPFINKMVRDFALYKFYLGFYNLFDAGHPMGRSFLESTTLVRNQNILAHFRPIVDRIRKDTTLEDAMEYNRIFPDTDVNMLITGEKSGRLDEQLKELLQIYERRIDTYFNILKTLLPVIIFICISIYIGFVVYEFYKEYYDNLFESIDF